MTRTRTRPSTRARAALAGALVLLGLATGCGIPADEGPRAIDNEQIPDDGDAATGETGEGRTVLADLYFTSFDGSRDNLVRVQREVPTGGSSSAPTPSTVLENLLDGTDDAVDQPVGDDPGNTVTKIPPDTALADPPELVDGILTVDLNGVVNDVQGEGARLAYGQMVCTAEALDEIEGVLFTIEGEPVNAPTDGENSSDPLTCDSYANLLAGAGG